jgi:hypothetical protein
MKLLRWIGCSVFGHAPIVERRGANSVLACERCRRVLSVFVENMYAREERDSRPVSPVEGPPDLAAKPHPAHPVGVG